MHSVKTTIATDPAGKITGYGISIEAETTGEADEIRACIAASLDMIRQAIQEQLIAAIAAPPVPAPTAPAPAAPYRKPATPEEAEARFFARYKDIIGGESWLDVRAYLGHNHPKPQTIDGWISAAEAVRDRAEQEQQRDEEAAPPPPPASTRRSASRRAA